MTFSSDAIAGTVGNTALVGAGNQMVISNLDNTNLGSFAGALISTGGASAGDPNCIFTVTGATSMTVGLDNSDSDSFKISNSGALGTNDRVIIATTGNTTINPGTASVGNQILDCVSNLDGLQEVRCLNQSDTSGATAGFTATVGGTSASDPSVKWVITGASTYTAGIDNSASDVWQLTFTNGLGSSVGMEMTSVGEVTFPATPAFSAHLATTDSNVTGAGTLFQIGSGNAWTEYYDQNSDFNTNGTFVAPVAGRYQFSWCVSVSDIAAGMTTGYVQLTTTGETFRSGIVNPLAVADSSAAAYSFTGSISVNMAATDSATLSVIISGGGGNTVEVAGDAAGVAQTYWSGELIC